VPKEPTIVGVQQAREQLRDLLDAAVEQGEHTVISRYGRHIAVLVPYGWYINETVTRRRQ